MLGGRLSYYSLPDTYQPLRMLLSTRKANPSHSGACMRVRRSNDNAEQDIGFSSNDLNTSSLLSFTGANNGFVVTWYDQGGAGQDFANPTAAAQPQIVSSGSVITDAGGKPAVQFATKRLYRANLFAGRSVSDFTLYCYCRVTTSSAISLASTFLFADLESYNAANVIGFDPLYNSNTTHWWMPNSTTGLLTASSSGLVGVDVLHTAQAYTNSGGTKRLRRDGTTVASDTNAGTVTHNPYVQIGRWPGAQYFQGRIGEIRAYHQIHDDATRNAIEADIMAYY